MFSKTTETAIMALIHVVLRTDQRPVSPRAVAAHLGVSPSYLAKIFNILRRAGILRAHRGAHGGVTLNRQPTQINLLDIVSACQELSVNADPLPPARMANCCNFHQAINAVGRSIEAVMVGWTLADLAIEPCPVVVPEDSQYCRVSGMCPKRKVAAAEEGHGFDEHS